jgi:hypothetical protein
VERVQLEQRVCPARQLVNPKFLRMLALFVSTASPQLALAGADAAMMQPLGDFCGLKISTNS